MGAGGVTATTEWRSLLERYARLRAISAFVVERPDRRRAAASAIGTPMRLDLTESLEAEIRSRTRDRIDAERATRVVSYDPGHRPEPSEVIALPLDDVPGLKELCDAATSEALTSFGGGADERRRLALYGVALGRGAEAIVCLQQYTPRLSLRPDKFLLLVHRGRVYDELADGGFAFDLNFDLFVSGEYVFALDKAVLERVLGYIDQIREEARANAQSIAARLPIANSDEFIEACARDLRLARKAAAIVARSTFNNLTVAAVVQHAEKHDVELRVDEDDQIVFSNLPAERWNLLKILDDDYLESGLTQSRYEVNSKIAR
jgi:hypothetical protein